MASLDRLSNDCLHLIFERLVADFSDFFALAVVSRLLSDVAKDAFCRTAVFNFLAEHKDLVSFLKYSSFYQNASPFDTLLWQFSRHELTQFMELYKKPFSAKAIVAADLLRRYPTLHTFEQGVVKQVLIHGKMLPGNFDSFSEYMREPWRFTKILLLDWRMRKTFLKALGYSYLMEIYTPWLFISVCTIFMFGIIIETSSLWVLFLFAAIIAYICKKADGSSKGHL